MTAATDALAPQRPDLAATVMTRARRNAWTLALLGIFIGMLVVTKLIPTMRISTATMTSMSVKPAESRRRRRVTSRLSAGPAPVLRSLDGMGC